MTSNVDVKDHLINGAFVEVVDFEHKCNNDGHNYVHAVLVKFDKSKCGENLVRQDLICAKDIVGRILHLCINTK